MQYCGAFSPFINIFNLFWSGTGEETDCSDGELKIKRNDIDSCKSCEGKTNQLPWFLVRRNKVGTWHSLRKKRSVKRRRSLRHMLQNINRRSSRLDQRLVEPNEYDLECMDCDENMKVLERLFPTSTESERRRFVIDRTLGRSIEKMDNFMIWRKETKVDHDTFISKQLSLVDDLDCWNFVVSFTADRMGVKLTTAIPQIIRLGNDSEEIRTLCGKRVAHILAAMIDLELASQEFYSACVVSYLHFKLDRESLETIAVLVDVRPGNGWKNPPGLTLLPFIKVTAKTLGHTMPERLDVCIVYPLPSPAKVIWLLISSFLDVKHVEKIQIIWAMGATATADTAAPMEEMKEYFDLRTIDLIERVRISQFVSDTNQ